MSDPFKIIEPTCISFSGGRTSAYMLWRVLQSNGGLPDDAVVCFANTGKEDEATLEFVRDCAANWNVPITWLEYHSEAPFYKVVSFETAGRNGEPFEAVIRRRNYLPNPVTRFCTGQLKIRPMGSYLYDLGFARTKAEGEGMSMVGIRADEPRRAAKIADKSRVPLFVAGVTKGHVGDFWRKQSFDLNLPNHKGVTPNGNCDLCFLKGKETTLSLIAEKPERAYWWIKMESTSLASKPLGARFRKDRPSYAELHKQAISQPDLLRADDESIPCFCGD